jgi:carbon storage regulator CsrA
MVTDSAGRGERQRSNVVLIVTEVQGDRVKLGFDAPWQVAIHRREMYGWLQPERSAGRTRAAGGIYREHSSPSNY